MHTRSMVVAGCILVSALTRPALAQPASSAAQSTPASPSTPAASIDLRPVFRNWQLTPRAQGPRGTCSVFAVTQAIEYAAATARREGVRLSPEFLNWASNDATALAQDGGFFSDLWKGFESHGICPERSLAYASIFDPDIRPSAQVLGEAEDLRSAGLALHWIKTWDINTGLSEQHMEEIKAALRRQWPVCAGLRWPKRPVWNQHVLAVPAPADVFDGHSVLFVGYTDDPALPGGGAFMLRDSASGTDDELMPYQYALAYTNDAAWIDAPIAPPPGAPQENAGAPQPATQRTPAAAPDLRDLLNPAGPAPAGRNRRVSSNQQPQWHTENLDMTWLQPGTSIEMPLLEGPGVITHMWFTSHSGWAHELNALSLRIFYDGETTPSVEVPLGDFFAVGQGTPAVVESIPVQVSPTGALSCYWRMPFAKSAKITVTNDNPDRGTGLYWQVDWTQLESLPHHTPRFYARYRQEYPATSGQDYIIADLRGTGTFVGTVMSVTSSQSGWFGEGDDFFYIDDETTPSLQGTGSEDYFNDAWGFRPRTSHWFGSPRWQGDNVGDSGICYRWHVPDAVNFQKSLKVAIEHKGNHAEDTEGFFVERPDFISSVALWYQEPGAENPMRLPAWKDRRIPWLTHHFVGSFTKTTVTGDAKPQIDTSGLFGARPMLLWPNARPGESLSVPFTVPEDGRYAARLIAGMGPAFGRYDVKIDGKPVAAAALRSPDQSEIDLGMGAMELTKGSHTISFTALPEQPGPIGIETLRLLKLPPEAKREPKTHHEAHFVRLAIGRATYAYRLAFGKVPESLKTLVDANVLNTRYLNDENNVPLVSHSDGEALIVESTQGEKWSHRWQGLDARR